MTIKEAQYENPGSSMDYMPLAPYAQPTDLTYETKEDINFDEDEAGAEDENDAMVVLELEEDGEPEFLSFDLPMIPGSDDEGFEIEEDESIEVEEEEEDHLDIEEPDKWDWSARGGVPKFLSWLQEMIHAVPRHSGRDTTGLERAISYFEVLDKEITKAMRLDFKEEIDSAKAEEARAQIEEGLERLVERLEKVKTSKYKRHAKKKKKSEADHALVKEAMKSTNVSGIVITVPIFISRLARVCINGMVSAGHDIEDTFHDQAKRWKLTDREQAELLQLLQDMGYMPSSSMDRGFKVDESRDPTSSDNYDLMANFPG